jgi:ribosomal-protein-alanine N-acetyltransferase
MNTELPSLITKSLILRPLQETDAETLHCIYQTEGVLQYFPNPIAPPIEKVGRFIKNQLAHWEKHGYGNWGVVLEGEAEIIGWAGLQFLPELNETEVGFLLDRPFWGRGYATEAAKASLQFGFNPIQLDHIIALVHPENMASQRVITKCGMGYMDTLGLWGIQLKRYQVNRQIWEGN